MIAVTSPNQIPARLGKHNNNYSGWHGKITTLDEADHLQESVIQGACSLYLQCYPIKKNGASKSQRKSLGFLPSNKHTPSQTKFILSGTNMITSENDSIKGITRCKNSNAYFNLLSGILTFQTNSTKPLKKCTFIRTDLC